MRKLTAHKGNPLNDAIEVLVLDQPGAGNACHVYEVVVPTPTGDKRTRIQFQNGPIAEVGVNNLSNEVLLAIVADRLEGFQSGPFKCKDNEDALGLVKAGLTCLHKRTKKRTEQGVEGKSEPHRESLPPTPEDLAAAAGEGATQA